MRYFDDFVYVPAHVKRRRVEAQRTLLAGKGLTPAFSKGRREIALTFWGRAWCTNLESYSDYSNRLPRGRTYLRGGAVLDLKIEPGIVKALVQGRDLYTVKIEIKPLAAARWTPIRDACAGQIESLVELLRGQLPPPVMTLVTQKDSGLFPAPKEIVLSCSCPDWATMCKHVAAALYGVGARLDEEPQLLFVLREVDHTELVTRAVSESLVGRLDKAAQAGPSDDELSALFGIEIAEVKSAPAKAKKVPKKAVTVKPAKRASRVTSAELRKRGLSPSAIQSFLIGGTLLRTAERGVYRTTTSTEERLQSYLALVRKGVAR